MNKPGPSSELRPTDEPSVPADGSTKNVGSKYCVMHPHVAFTVPPVTAFSSDRPDARFGR